jgi:stage II sporulation protein D
MSLKINQGININTDNSIFNKLSIKNVDDKPKVNSLLDSNDISSIKKISKTPFQTDINTLYNNEMEKLSNEPLDLKALPDFNKTPLKVGIAVEQKQATFYIPNGTLFVETEEGKKEIGAFENKSFIVKNENNGISLYHDNGKLIGNYKGKITLDGNLTPISINGKKYRGEMEVIVNPKNPSTLHVVNEVMLEDYLKSVVPSESPSSWPVESLKAQAVAARTYAVGNWKRRESLGFDLMPTVADQMYTGIEAERASSNQAVKETTGQVLIHNGKPINALFFSCSGGYTDSASEVWNTNEYPYIQPAKDFDQNAPKYKWEKSFTNQDIQKGLNQLGQDVGEIKDIKGIEFTPQKRVKKVEITGTKGKVVVDSNKFRFAIGLNSTLWNVESSSALLKKSPSNFTFKGGGWGHGLGMSQWGANQMSQEGKKYEEILKHYYTGVELSNILNEPQK